LKRVLFFTNIGYSVKTKKDPGQPDAKPKTTNPNLWAPDLIRGLKNLKQYFLQVLDYTLFFALVSLPVWLALRLGSDLYLGTSEIHFAFMPIKFTAEIAMRSLKWFGILAAVVSAVFLLAAWRRKNPYRAGRVTLTTFGLLAVLAFGGFIVLWQVFQRGMPPVYYGEISVYTLFMRYVQLALVDQQPLTSSTPLVAVIWLLLPISFVLALLVENRILPAVGLDVSSKINLLGRRPLLLRAFRILSIGAILLPIALSAYAASIRPDPMQAVFADAKLPVRNVLLISIDTLRADHLSCYGYNRETSPYIDQFAAEGVLFEQAISLAPWTLPSHMTMMTGLAPSVHGVDNINTALSPQIPTLAQVFAENGFSTGAFVSIFNLSPGYGFGPGFETYRLVQQDAEVVLAQAEKWIQTQDRPFFSFVHLFDAHYPYNAPGKFRGYFGKRNDGLKDLVQEHFYKFLDAAPSFDEATRQAVIDRYDEEIGYVDNQLGHFIESLRKSGVLDQTLVLITSDHGEEFYDHGFWGHAVTLFDEHLHVPLIVRAPGLTAGQRISNQVNLGQLWELIFSTIKTGTIDAPPGNIAYSETTAFGPRRFAVRGNGKKYTESYSFEGGNFGRSYPESLYDILVDPKEQVNLLPKAQQMATLYKELLKLYKKSLPDSVDKRTMPLDPAALENLKALGYVSGP
jgi:hypothetical protein